MKKKIVAVNLVMLLAVSGVAGCTSNASDETVEETVQSETSTGSHASKNTVALTEGEYNEKELDDSWSESNAVIITLSKDSVEILGNGAQAEGSTVTITAAGEYVISGELSNGRIVVNVVDKGDVKLVLNSASITSNDAAAIEVEKGNTVITLAKGSQNHVTDGGANSAADRANAAIYGKDDLVFNGSGSLTVTGNYKNGIQSKDDLKFVSGTYDITAVNHGLLSKDSVTVKDGSYTITAENDGIQAANAKESDKGYIIIDGGKFNIVSGADGLQAETLLLMNGGEFDITAGGGHQEAEQRTEEFMPGGGNRGNMRPGGNQEENGDSIQRPQRGEQPADMGEMPEGEIPPDIGQMPEGEAPGEPNEIPSEVNDETEADTASTKGLKSYVDLIISGGNITIDARDDGLHSDQSVYINGGILEISAGDDGIHADEMLSINDGEINILTSYEGLEGYTVEINGGSINLQASDDGINAAQASDGIGSEMGMAESQGAVLTISGGEITVNASGDGVDANGKIYMTDGTLMVHGPVMGGNGTFDYDEEFILSGGTILSVGTPSMAQTASDSSTQAYISNSLNETITAGMELVVSDEEGAIILSFIAEKDSSWYMFSWPEIEAGRTYIVQAGELTDRVTAK